MLVFDHLDYKAAIREAIAEHRTTRGYQQKLAEAVRCQKSYFSQMLRADKTHLNAEQMMRLAMFWRMNTVETDYLLELLSLAKASFAPLRRRIQARLDGLKATAANLSKRYADTIETLPDASSLTYYSSWTWSAVHILVGIPAFETAGAIAARLSIPVELASDTLESLQTLGLVVRDGKRWRIKPGHVHLPRESPLTAMNHSNWRNRAVLDAHRRQGDGLHYTAVHSHSHGDFHRIKDIILRAVDQSREVMQPSADEEATCLCLDYFRL